MSRIFEEVRRKLAIQAGVEVKPQGDPDEPRILIALCEAVDERIAEAEDELRVLIGLDPKRRG